MSVVKWEPFRDLMTLQDRMNHVFLNESLLHPGISGMDDEFSRLRDWVPAVDIFENTDSVMIKAELPGMDMKDIDVKIEDSMLSLKGERKLEQEEKRENYHCVERVYGTFHRVFTLPSTVDAEKIHATYEKGVLTITLPKKEETRPRTIKIAVQ